MAKRKGKGKGAAAPKPVAAAPSGAATLGMTLSQKVTWYSLVALVFLVPLAMSNANWAAGIIPALRVPFTYDQFDIVKVFVMRACALVGLAAWAWGFFMRGGKLRRTKADWLILALLAWILLTSFTSIHPPTAIFGKYRRFEGWLSFVTYAVTYFLVVQTVDRPSRIRSLAATLMLSSGIVAIHGVLQVLGKDPVNWGSVLPFEFNRAFATFGNPDLLGGFLIFPLIIAPCMALSERRIGWRVTYWVVWFLIVVTWITSFVRGAWIGGFVGLVIVAVAAWRARPGFEWPDYTAAGLTGLTAAGVIAWSSTNEHPVLNFFTRLSSIVKFNEGSSLTRFEIWQAAINAIKVRPILGFGADTFRLVFPKYKPIAYTKDAGYISVADNVHDYPLQMASAIGIPGVLLLYGTFAWILLLSAPNAFARDKGADRLVITGFWAAAVGYLTHLMTGLSVTGSTIFLWIAFAIVMTPIARTVDVKAIRGGAPIAFIALALCTLLSIGNLLYIVADNYYLRGQFGMVNSGETPVGLLETAVDLNPFNDMYRAQIGQEHLKNMTNWLSQAQQQRNQGQDSSQAMAQAKAAFDLAEKALKASIAYVPSEYDNYVFLAALYNNAGQAFDPAYHLKAIEIADQGIKAEPFGPLVRYQKAAALVALGRWKEALPDLAAGYRQDPAFVEGTLMYGELLSAAGDHAKAEKVIGGFLKNNPDSGQAKAIMERIEASASAEASEGAK